MPAQEPKVRRRRVLGDENQQQNQDHEAGEQRRPQRTGASEPIAGSLVDAPVLSPWVGLGNGCPGDAGLGLLIMSSLPDPGQNETDSGNRSSQASVRRLGR